MLLEVHNISSVTVDDSILARAKIKLREGLFTSWNDITQKRTKLKPDTAQRLAFVQLNIQRLLPLISHVPIDESEEKENAEVLDLGEETDDEE